MSRIKSRNLEWGSANRPKVSNKLGIPHRGEGSDGDIQVRQTNLGAKLFGKIGGRWNSTFLSSEDEIIGTSGTKIGMDSSGALTVDQIKLEGKISLTSTGTQNICIGTGNSDLGSNNIAIGVGAGNSYASGNESNIAIGTDAAKNLVGTVDGTIAIGKDALKNLDISDGSADFIDHNIAIGTSAMENFDEGGHNVAIGQGAMGGAVGSGASNCAVGHAVAASMTTGSGNTCIGTSAGTSITEGTHNVCLGWISGKELTTGTYNIAIGYASELTAGLDYQIAIGALTEVTGAYGIAIGKSVTAAEQVVTIGLSTDYITCDFGENATWSHATSDRRAKKDIVDNTLGLSFINDLKTVTYKRRPPSEYPEEFETYDAEKTERKNPDKIHYGFIAQDVKEAMDKSGLDEFPAWMVSEAGCQSIGETQFLTPLVKAVQELSAKVDAMQEEINNL